MMRSKKPNPRRAPTSIDVAKAAGVSQTTVSHVFNNTVGRPIRAETRKRVLQAARDLGYRPNASARALKKGHSDEIILFSIGPLSNSAAAQGILSTQARSHELGYSLGTYFFDTYSPEEWHGVLEQAFSRHPAGVIASAYTVTEADYRWGQSMGVSAWAFVSLEPIGFAPAIVVPYEDAGRLAGLHLVERGHRHVAYVAPRRMAPTRQSILCHTLQGLKAVLEPHGVRLTELVMDTTLEDARAAVDVLLRLPDRPTAVYSCRDDYCFPLLKAMAQRGLRIPEDIAVVGTDNGPSCSLSTPSLTSVGYDVQTIFCHLVDIVDAQIRGKKPAPELFVSHPFQLVVRESS